MKEDYKSRKTAYSSYQMLPRIFFCVWCGSFHTGLTDLHLKVSQSQMIKDVTMYAELHSRNRNSSLSKLAKDQP